MEASSRVGRAAQRAFARSRNGGSWLDPEPVTASSNPRMNPVLR